MYAFESLLGITLILICSLHQSLGITHGWETTPHSAPYQAWIIIDESLPTHSSCGGTLITANFVLTSAYCIFRKTSLAVILGAHNISDNEETQVRVLGGAKVTHPLYNISRYDYDIGLIKLTQGVEQNDFIKFATLPATEDFVLSGLYASTFGWGITSEGYYCKRPNVLMEVQNTVMIGEHCNELYGEISDRENAICFSGDRGTGACEGDQGGPLVYHGVQYGITNYFTPGCTKGRPTVFTRVASFLDWIESNSDWQRPL